MDIRLAVARGEPMTLYETEPSLRSAVTPRTDHAIWPLTTIIDELDRLCIGNVALTEIADEFRTPTYVIDEGLDLDLYSTTALATALSAGVDPERIIMHGNTKNRHSGQSRQCRAARTPGRRVVVAPPAPGVPVGAVVRP